MSRSAALLGRDPLGPDRILEYWSWVAWALFLLVTVDMLTTIFAASVLGTAAEANPLMRWALGRGIGVIVAVNIAAVVLVVTFFYGLVRMLERTPERYRAWFSLLVEVWLGLLLFAGLAVFANNLTAIVLGQSLL
jgi:hypothetical protein